MVICKSSWVTRLEGALLVMTMAACQSLLAQPASDPVEPEPALAPKTELPPLGTDHLRNPAPVYPYLSKIAGEQGSVVVRVLVGLEGKATQVEISQSSGFARLDEAALTAVKSWRYVPGKRGGVPEAMWAEVPINFVLE